MMLTKRFIKVLTTAALMVFMMEGALAAKSIKLHHINPNQNFGNPSGASALVFKNLVESGSNGDITVEIFPDSQLGKDNEVLQQVKTGIIQMGIHSTGGLASVYPMISVLDIPFGFPNHAVAYEVLDGPFGKKIAADITRKTGMVCLGFNDSGGFFQITNSRRPIKSAEDMKGLKIRTMSLPTHQAFISSLGGQPVAISWSEVYSALQTGVADGQMNPIPIVEFAKLYEVQKYMTITNHLFAPQMWMVNQKFWDSLSAAEKDLVRSSVYAAITTSRGIANAIEASERGLPFLKDKMEVNSLTPEAKAKMAEVAVPAARAIIEKNLGNEGKEMLEDLLKAVAEAGK